MTVVWLDRAMARLGEIQAFLASHNPIAAARLLEEVIIAGDSLEDFPDRGSAGRVEGTFELQVAPPYVLVYQLREGDVVILAIWHGAQERPAPN